MGSEFSRLLKAQELRTGLSQKKIREALHGLGYRTYKHWVDGEKEPSKWLQGCVLQILSQLPDDPEIITFEKAKNWGKDKTESRD